MLLAVNLLVWSTFGAQYCGVQIVWGLISYSVSLLTSGSIFSGIQGRPVELFSNHVQLRSCSQRNLYKYNVIYTPGIEDGRKREALLSELEKLLGKCHIYDGNYLLLPHPLGEMVKYYYSTFCWHCSFSPIFTLPFSICYSQTHTVPVKQIVEISCMPLTHMTYNKITCHVWLSLIL